MKNKQNPIQKWLDFKAEDNAYFRFIQACKEKSYDGEQETHMHHIIPKHMFGDSSEELEYCESPDNLIKLSVADHVTAHQLLFGIYKYQADKGAVLMLQGDKEASRKIWRTLGARAVHRLSKEKGAEQTFWNKDFQKEMAQRSMARPDALQIRSAAGKLGGQKRNQGRAIKLAERFEFSFEGAPVLCIFNCDSGTLVLEELNKFEKKQKKQKTKLSRVSPLLKGTKKNLHGWSCRKI
jgi:hypothetical protein